MNRRIFITSIFPALSVLFSGCASYRTSSNAEPTQPAPTNISAGVPTKQVLLSESGLPDRRFMEIGPIEVAVKKLTIFHKDPTREQAKEALIERANALGADAVINITYKSGIGLTTWGYVEAKGMLIKFLPDSKFTDAAKQMPESAVSAGAETPNAPETSKANPTWSTDAKRAYKVYLGRNDPRGFVIDRDSRFFWLSGHQWDGRPPSAHALEKCVREGGQDCRVVDINGRLVGQ